MNDDLIHYAPSLNEIERSRALQERVPENVQAIREEIESLNANAFEHRELEEKVIELLERQNELLESIDHAHYYRKSDESVFLARILILVFILTVGLGIHLLISWLQ